MPHGFWEGLKLAIAAVVGWVSRHITYRNGGNGGRS